MNIRAAAAKNLRHGLAVKLKVMSQELCSNKGQGDAEFIHLCDAVPTSVHLYRLNKHPL